MFEVALYAIVSVLVVSTISLIGLVAISLKEKFLQKILFFLVALAIGALLGDSFIHLIPEALEESSNTVITSLFIIFGIISFFILEKYLHFHHEHTECRHIDGEDCDEKQIKPVGKLILFSDGFHNFIDGMIIGISYLVSIPVGIATTVAVMLHEIPQEVGDFGILLFAGYTRKRALFYNFLSALTAIVGVFVVLLIGETLESFLAVLIPFTAGIFIYIAIADLVPELHRQRSTSSSFFELLGIFLGIGAMLLLLLLE